MTTHEKLDKRTYLFRFRCVSQAKIVFVSALLFSVFADINPAIASESVSYQKQVLPILKEKCISCHGNEKEEGGLRLDSEDAILRGGDSQQPIFGSSIESSEVIKRITSNDPDYRMPPKGDSLDQNKVELIKNWVSQGANFDSGSEKNDSDKIDKNLQGNFVAHVLDLFSDSWNSYTVIFLIVILTSVVLIIELKKKKILKSENDFSETHWIRKIHVSYYCFAYLLLIFVVVLNWNQQTIVAQQKRIDELKMSTSALRLKNSQLQRFGLLEKYYGNPPRPKRLDHPIGLSQVYYRGNDERSPELFNGGYYRTSKMNLRLIDSNGDLLKPGDPFPEDGALLEFNFNRPSGTSSNLYQEEVVGKTFVSREYPHKYAEVDPEKVELENIESGKQWAIRYPIQRKKDAQDLLGGILYVYFGKRLDFGIVYRISLKEGQIEKSSDIWMGNLLCMQKLLPPSDVDYITQEEWFDYKPIPIPKRHKKHSAKLLGEEEHIKKKPN